jgi:DNA-binding transcriptional LysR family regulator
MCVASSFATYWLIPRLSGFVTAHPEVTLNLSTHIGPVDFSASPHDAAIEFCSGAQPGLSAQLILPLDLAPYCAPSLLKSAVDGKLLSRRKNADIVTLLNTRALIRHTTVPHAWTSWVRQAGFAGQVKQPQLENGPQYDLLSMALNGAIAGIGIALLPQYVAAGAVDSGSLIRIASAQWRSEKGYHLRYPEWKADLVALKRFQDWLRAQELMPT